MVLEKTKKKQVPLRTHAKGCMWVCAKAKWYKRGGC